MKYVMKFLCAIAITVFMTSCASSGSGCYDFGGNSKVNPDNRLDNIEFVSFSKKENNDKIALTICDE